MGHTLFTYRDLKEFAQGHAQDDHEEEQTWQQTM